MNKLITGMALLLTSFTTQASEISIFVKGNYRAMNSNKEHKSIVLDIKEVSTDVTCRTSRNLNKFERIFSFAPDGKKHKYKNFSLVSNQFFYDQESTKLEVDMSLIQEENKATFCSHFIGVKFSYLNPYSKNIVSAYSRVIFDNTSSKKTRLDQLLNRDGLEVTINCRSIYKKPSHVELNKDGQQYCVAILN